MFLVAIKLAGLIVIFDPYGLQSFDLPKSVFSRVTAIALAVAVVASLARFGPRIFPRTRLHLAVVGLFLANLVSAFYAENRYVAVFGEQGRYQGLTFLLDMIVLYVAITIAFRTLQDWNALAAAVGTAGAVALCYGVVQAMGWDPIAWQPYSGQPFSTFGQGNVFGHFLSVAFGVSLGVAAAGVLGNSRVRMEGVVVALVVAGFATIVANRGTLLGVGTSLALFAFLVLRYGPRRSWTQRDLARAGALSLAVILLTLTFTPLGSRVMRSLEDQGSGRLSFYRSAVAATLARPAFGFGPDGFGVAYPGFREPPPDGPPEPLTSAHDWILQTSATTGIVGLAALVGVVASFGVALFLVGLRRMPSVAIPLLFGYVAYWATALVTVGSIGIDWFPWLCYGAAAAIRGEQTVRATPLRRSHITIAATAIVVGVAALVVPWQAFQANRQAGQARAEWTRQRSESAISAAEAAVALDPGRAEYWNWVGLGFDQAGMPRRAGDAFEEAARRSPHEGTYWVNAGLARARQSLGGDDPVVAREAALLAAARAVAVDPYVARFNSARAGIAMELGDFDTALRSAIAATLLQGDAPSGDQAFPAAQRVSDLPSARLALEAAIARRETAQLRLALAEVALRMNDTAEARRNVQRALALKPDDDDALRLLEQLQP